MDCGLKKTACFLMLAGLALALQAAPPVRDPLREKAAAGDAEAAFYLANEYFYGENRPENHTLAAYWFLKAAEKGIPEAQYNYASCLESGRGVKADIDAAFAWYKKASDQNFEPAMFRIARFYAAGLRDAAGQPILLQDSAAAVEMLEKLALREYEPAELELASLRMARGSSPANQRYAYKLLCKITARKQYSPAALRMLADCLFSGLGCERDRSKAAELLKRASDLGDPEASAKMGFLYEYGQQVRPDPKLALEYYRKAAEAGHPMAQFKYAEAIVEGNVPGKKMADALPWYRSSAKLNCPQALFRLGVLYYDGAGVTKDLRQAAKYFFQAAKMGYARAQFNLANMFDNGEITGKPDREAAFYWYMECAKRGDVRAQRQVAERYLKGLGVDRSISNAEQWLRTAAENGDFSAGQLLTEIEHTAYGGF
ncbi:MAG: sel1 repeat family protein [Lentisphaeria bacterium]|nr:sel1 repeat family protein [Lentisphaeria bacterium]